MIPQKYIPPIKYLGGAIIIILTLGWGVYPLASSSFSEDLNDEVLVSSIPFITIFISILLGYILLIFIFIIRFNHKIPRRTYQGIDRIIIAGIIIGTIMLFQPIRLVGFQYGFSWLLISTLLYTMWSRIKPLNAMREQELTPFRPRAQVIGAIMGGIVAVLIIVSFVIMVRPEAPYNYSDRQWERGLREEQRIEIIAEAESTYRNFTIPYFIFMSLIPASFVFFVTREIIASTVSVNDEMLEASVNTITPI